MRFEYVVLNIITCFLASFTAEAYESECNFNNNIVTCLRKNLKLIPKVPNSTYVLDVRYNAIRNISKDDFLNLSSLGSLYLSDNKLTVIRNGDFNGLEQVVNLHLSRNYISLIEPGVFDGMTHLNQLFLNSNEIHSLHPDIFSHLRNLEYLYLNDNKIKSLSKRTFTGLLRLRQLRLNNNLLSCDCSFIWIFEMIKQHPHLHVNATCLTLDGSNLSVNNSEENNFYCSNPSMTISPINQNVFIGQELVQFDCKAEGKPNPHTSWLFNGNRIVLDDRIDILRNGSLTIKIIKEQDSGLYACQAQNSHGTITSSATLTIGALEAVEVIPKHHTIFPGDTIELLCTLEGTDDSVILWYHNKQLLKSNHNFLMTNNNRYLTILKVSNEESGEYQCVEKNKKGETREEIFKIVLKASKITAPKIKLKPEDSNSYSGTTIQLNCEVDSDIVSIEWRKDGSKIIADARFKITQIGSLIIKNLTITDTGSYECSVFNEYGRDRAAAFLTVKEKKLPSDEYINVAVVEASLDIERAINNSMKQIFGDSGKSLDFHNIFRISRYPNEPARDIARAAEIYERTLFKLKEYSKNGLKARSSDTFTYKDILSRKHLEVIARLSGCTIHRKELNCSNIRFHEKYRTLDGTCNNLENPYWGSSLSGFRRILHPIYEDGFSKPVGWNKSTKYNGFVLPSARKISNTVITTINVTEHYSLSHMVMQWGQWLDHDLTHSLPSVSSQTWDGVDCKKTCDFSPPCFPIEVPADDPRIKNRRCIDFTRTSSVCGSGMTSVLFGKLQAREQINQLTSFIDASQVYGYERVIGDDLRDLTNDNGLLRVGALFPGKKPLLPTIGINGMDCRRNLTENTRNCFVAGDIRANEQVGLAAMHTIWMREHNRIAMKLKTINPFWDGDKIYHEARKIVGAETQFITYNHWLPLVVGSEGYRMLGDYKGYRTNLDPSISNVFATAAFRFGHSIINPVLHRYDEDFEPIPQGHLLLRHAFFSPWRLVEEGGVDPLIRGMFLTPGKLKTPTEVLNSELTEKLFFQGHPVALDLAALNIQRSRDHAIPPYYKWREFCNMSSIENFDDLKNEISSEIVRNKLKDLYGSPYNIDVWVGGILEDQVEGGLVGPLFRCLILEQMTRSRDGDRFWFENESIFKPNQVEQIKQTSLARVLCDNTDNIDSISENVFLYHDNQYDLTACDDLPIVDLQFWADCMDCHKI